MADEAQSQTIRSINWREVFPFTHLFRAFRIAVHPSKLMLALAALLLIYLGGRVLDGAWNDNHLSPAGEFRTWPPTGGENVFARRLAGLETTVEPGLGRRGIFISFFESEVSWVNGVAYSILGNNWFGGNDLGLGLGNARPGVFPAIWQFMAVGPGTLFRNHPFYALLFTAWFLVVWSVFGGAISRIAAVHVARDEKISVRQALRFSISKVLSFLFAPLIPLLIIVIIGGIVAVTGWVLLHIPYAGPILTGLLFFLALIAGFVMTLVALGTLGGFNLMFPTVAVEGSDSFDAISRSFSYVFARPWRMLVYTAVAIAYGAITYLFVRLFIFVMLAMTHYFVGWLLFKGDPAKYWNGLDGAAAMWPPPRWENLTYHINYAGLRWSEQVAAGAISFWVYLTIGLLGAYAISYYFSANTIIYYLMRREVDATELDDVYVEESEDEFGDPVPAPAAGDAAAPATPVTAASTVPEGAAGGARAYGGPEGETRPESTTAAADPGPASPGPATDSPTMP